MQIFLQCIGTRKSTVFYFLNPVKSGSESSLMKELPSRYQISIIPEESSSFLRVAYRNFQRLFSLAIEIKVPPVPSTGWWCLLLRFLDLVCSHLFMPGSCTLSQPWTIWLGKNPHNLASSLRCTMKMPPFSYLSGIPTISPLHSVGGLSLIPNLLQHKGCLITFLMVSESRVSTFRNQCG